jgi:DNA segregation ATPase FtsK/SpoIIIE-like protein
MNILLYNLGNLMTANRPLRVFLCHSSNDKPAVRELYQKLRAEAWIEPWLDEEELYPGQDWNMEIEKAVEDADAIIVCLSKGSITKEGYVQRELRIVLDFADYKPEGTIYLLPVRLEECDPPRRLRPWQYADYFEGQRERGIQRLLVSLKKRATSLNLDISKEIARLDDDLLEKAIAFIRKNQLASTNLLQDHLKISYIDAANLMDMLEEMGVVGPSKGRDVNVVDTDFLNDEQLDD